MTPMSAADLLENLALSHRMRIDPQFGMKEPSSYEGLVLDRGTLYTEFGEELPRMESKQCYSNCFEIALRRPDLTYCEGWATSLIPVQHAWLVDEDGKVSDPTWGHREGVSYIGIEFSNEEIIDCMERSTYGFSMLYPSTRDHPLMERPEADS